MISVRELTKLYGDFPAVRRISFDVGAGEILGLVGPNGAGKTTTLRCIAGIIAPSTGRGAIAGHDIPRDAIEAKRALAFIPDEPHLFEYLTVEEHLRFIARLYGVADVETRMPAAARRAGADREARVAARRAVARHATEARDRVRPAPRAVASDPRRAAHRARSRRACAGCARRSPRARAAGAAVILSSHLLHLVEELCTKLLVLRRGGVSRTARSTRSSRASRAGGPVARGRLPRADRRRRADRVNAFVYLTWTSGRNRFWTSVRRVRSPRYAAALLVGGLYIWAFLFRPMRNTGLASLFLGQGTEMVITLLSVLTLMGSWGHHRPPRQDRQPVGQRPRASRAALDACRATEETIEDDDGRR